MSRCQRHSAGQRSNRPLDHSNLESRLQCWCRRSVPARFVRGSKGPWSIDRVQLQSLTQWSQVLDVQRLDMLQALRHALFPARDFGPPSLHGATVPNAPRCPRPQGKRPAEEHQSGKHARPGLLQPRPETAQDSQSLFPESLVRSCAFSHRQARRLPRFMR